MNKKDLQRLEGLMLLVLLHKTHNKRLSASVVGISVDTLTKYLNFLEIDIGATLQKKHKNCCHLTSTANELIAKLKSLNIENWSIGNNTINMFDIKNIRGMFYLKAISFFGNKRNASLALATSIETINMYIGHLQKSLQIPLMYCDNQGSYLTSAATAIIIKFDRITNFIKSVMRKKSPHDRTIRLALEKGINISIDSFHQTTSQDIIVFTDNPDLYTDDWDIAISFSEPDTQDIIIFYKHTISCGFFTSNEYITNFGEPKDIEDIKKIHIVLDCRNKPYANENYYNFIDNCQKTKFIENSKVSLLDTVKYGGGICLAPLVIPRDNLVYLKHIPCNIEATIYLYIHKSFSNIAKYKQALDSYREILEHL